MRVVHLSISNKSDDPSVENPELEQLKPNENGEIEMVMVTSFLHGDKEFLSKYILKNNLQEFNTIIEGEYVISTKKQATKTIEKLENIELKELRQNRDGHGHQFFTW